MRAQGSNLRVAFSFERLDGRLLEAEVRVVETGMTLIRTYHSPFQFFLRPVNRPQFICSVRSGDD